MKKKIITNPIRVVNKPGGNNSVGMSYVASKKGSANILLGTSIGTVSTPIDMDLKLTYEDFRQIARLTSSSKTLVVKGKDGKINTLEKFKNFKGPLVWGGATTGTNEHFFFLEFAKASGMDIQFVPFGSDGSGLSMLLGGHIDMIATEALNNQSDYIKDGELAFLFTSGSKRTPELPEVPTAVELGWDAVVEGFLGFSGPPEMADDTVAWYEDKMRQLAQNERWQKDYLKAFTMQNGFEDSATFGKTLDKERYRLLQAKKDKK